MPIKYLLKHCIGGHKVWQISRGFVVVFLFVGWKQHSSYDMFHVKMTLLSSHQFRCRVCRFIFIIRVMFMIIYYVSQFFMPPLSRFHVQYIPRNMHMVFALLCFVVVIHWLIFPYPSGLLHWHCGNLTIAPVSAKQPWWIWINTSCEFIMNDCITTTKQSTAKPCAYFLGYTVWSVG